MFSKLFQGKNEEALVAMRMQCELAFAKCFRKFEKKKKSKTTKGRRPLGELKLNAACEKGKGVDLTSIARIVATTREGRRLHHKVTSEIQKNPETVCFCLCLFVVYLLFAC